MDSPHQPISFLSLPRELRDIIYELALDYPDMTPIFARARETISKHYSSCRSGMPWSSHLELPYVSIPKPRLPALQTPSLLLLNRQITTEALLVLRKKTWILSEPITNHIGVPIVELTDFIGAKTVQKILHVELRIDFHRWPRAPAWHRTVCELLDLWRDANELQSLRVVIVNGVHLQVRGIIGVKTAGDVLAKLQWFGLQVPKATFEGEDIPTLVPKRKDP